MVTPGKRAQTYVRGMPRGSAAGRPKGPPMSTTTTLTRAAGLAAAAAGIIFVGVQIGHPTMDAATIGTTEVVLRNSLKLVMAVLAVVGISAMYLHDRRRNGRLGLVGFVVLTLGYVLVAGTSFVAAVVLPRAAGTDPAYVNDAVAVLTGGSATGDVGLLGPVFQVQSATYLLGGLLFGIALLRAGVLSRWASALLAVGGLVSVALSLMPDAFYRLLALPHGIAMVALGISLWTSARATADAPAEVAVGAA